jgi:hypothetical protein
MINYVYSDLRATLAGKDLPEDIKQKMLGMHEDIVILKESLKTATDKLNKAKQVKSLYISQDCQLNRGLFASSSNRKTSFSKSNMRRVWRQYL